MTTAAAPPTAESAHRSTEPRRTRSGATAPRPNPSRARGSTRHAQQAPEATADPSPYNYTPTGDNAPERRERATKGGQTPTPYPSRDNTKGGRRQPRHDPTETDGIRGADPERRATTSRSSPPRSGRQPTPEGNHGSRTAPNLFFADIMYLYKGLLFGNVVTFYGMYYP